MASKERELLKIFMHELTKDELCSVSEELQAEINKLLAQPDTDIKEFQRGYGAALTNAVYMKEPKRKPLSNLAIKKASRDSKNMGFYNGVKWAEKAHGIGEGDE